MKRSESLEPLSHEHYEGLLAAGRVRKGLARQAPVDTIAAYVGHVWRTHLSRHFDSEETLLLPLLETHAMVPLAERMVSEHRQIRNLVAKVGQDPMQSAGRLAELSRAMMGHIRFEERQLFPAIEARVSEDVLRDVGAELHEARSDADLSWAPAFWE